MTTNLGGGNGNDRSVGHDTKERGSDRGRQWKYITCTDLLILRERVRYQPNINLKNRVLILSIAAEVRFRFC